MNGKWIVQYHFVGFNIQPIMFEVDDFASVLSVIRVIHFEDEVWKIEFWQSRGIK